MKPMKKEEIVSLLKSKEDYRDADILKFAAYCVRLQTETDRTGKLKNPWMAKREAPEMAELFVRVATDGLVFDGEDITLQATGVSYNYQAYKNKMLIAYPDSLIDTQLVYEGDKFEFSKQSGSVEYYHKIENPFSQKDEHVVGGYCVIKNKRGEFLTILSAEKIANHRAVAKTDNVWKQWFPEMCMKTLIKKACKTHFKDVFSNIENLDNENYDLENSGKSKIQILAQEIIDKLDVYQGDDKKQIQDMCKKAKVNKTFTIDFAQDVIKKLS